MSTEVQNAHQAAINVLARRVAAAPDVDEANSFAPAIAALAHDTGAQPLDTLPGSGSASTGGVTDPIFGTPSPVFPQPAPPKALKCTIAFRAATSTITAEIATVNAELKVTPVSSPKRAGLEKQLADLARDYSGAIASYTLCLKGALTVL